MAFDVFILPSLPSPSRCCRRNQAGFTLNQSQFLASKTISMLQKKNLHSLSIRIKQLKNPSIRALPIVHAAQSNFLRVWKITKEGVEAGANMVPDAIPRPVARISVSFVAVMFVLSVLKSFLSIAFFSLAVMGLSYFGFIALNEGDDPKRSGGEGTASVDYNLEEARIIMDKYK